MDGTPATAWFGTAEPVPAATPLQAGPLTADLVDGALRAVRWHGREVLRGIAYVVRDRDWGTLAPALRSLAVHQDAMGFRVTYDARCAAADGAVLNVRASISGSSQGLLVFDAEAIPDRDFETNRCGFCVLHPVVGIAGGPAWIEHVDGTVRQARFPDAIEPWQPFKDVRAITHEVGPGLRATCRMDGDTFETEDQRNWSDASYKTYVRPLALPWPYILPAGRPQRQAVSLAMMQEGMAAAVPRPERDTTVTLGAPQGRMPRMGLAVTPEEAEAVRRQADRLREVGPQALLLHFDPVAGHGAEALARLAAVRNLLPRVEAVLECVLPGVGDPLTELRQAAALVRDAGLRLDAVMVGPSVDRQSTPPGSSWPPCPPLEAVYGAARAAFPDLVLGGGMFSYFTELNRKRPPVAMLDFVSHCTCPIVHAADDVSVMQSLEALPFIVRSARGIVGTRPYRIGPSTIGMRQNPYGSRTFANPDGRRLTMTHADPRQRGLFAAAWLVGYLAQTAEADLDLFTAGALTGAFGLVAGEGGMHPVFRAVQGFAALAGAERLACRSSRPDRVLAVAARRDEGTVLWLANITGAPRHVALPAGFGAATIFDHETWPAIAGGRDPGASACDPARFVLAPYATARLERRP